jgi:hypothetical protein
MTSNAYQELAQRKINEALNLTAAQIAREQARAIIAYIQKKIESEPNLLEDMQDTLELWRRIYLIQDEACGRHQDSLERIEMEMLKY